MARVEPRSEDGVFLGVSDRSRPQVLERCVAQALGWSQECERDCASCAARCSSPAEMAEADAFGKARRLHIILTDIMKCGFTEGCVGCRALAELKRAQGHSEDVVHASSPSSPSRTMGEPAWEQIT